MPPPSTTLTLHFLAWSRSRGVHREHLQERSCCSQRDSLGEQKGCKIGSVWCLLPTRICGTTPLGPAGVVKQGWYLFPADFVNSELVSIWLWCNPLNLTPRGTEAPLVHWLWWSRPCDLCTELLQSQNCKKILQKWCDFHSTWVASYSSTEGRLRLLLSLAEPGAIKRQPPAGCPQTTLLLHNLQSAVGTVCLLNSREKEMNFYSKIES